MDGIIDADTHISEGAAMWAMMDQAMQPRRPVLLSIPDDTWYGNRNAFWLIDGEIFPKPAGKGSFALVTPSEQKVQEGRKDSTPATREMTDIKGRLADMDRLNTATQVVYPTLFLVYNTKDKELELALCRAYNRFMAQACAQSGGRMKWVVVLPFQTMNAAIDEIRFAKQNGAVGVFFRGIEGTRTLDDRYFFPVYQEASDLNLPICIHQGSGCPTFINFFDLERNRQWSHSAILPLFAFNDIVNNRIPEQFPKLRFGFIEAYATWVPYLLHSFKRQFRDQWKFSSTQDLFREFRIFIACETSENLPVIVDCIGEDNLVIGSDYGHNDPFEQRNLLPTLKSLTSIPERIVDKMVRDNPCALYGL